jgi:hypothetical protein
MIRRTQSLFALSSLLFILGCGTHLHMGVYLSGANYLELKQDKTYFCKMGYNKEVGRYEVEDQSLRLINKLDQVVELQVVGDTLLSEVLGKWVLWQGGTKASEFERAAKDVPRQQKVFCDDLMSLAREANRYRLNPKSRGGGEGSYVGFLPDETLEYTKDGVCTVQAQTSRITLTITSKIDLGSVSLSCDTASLYEYRYEGLFHEDYKDDSELDELP